MSDDQFRAWLFAPLTLADLLRVELAEASRQFGFIEAVELADALMADTDEAARWREVGDRADLVVLAEAAPNPYPERRRGGLPSTAAMIRRVTV